MRQVLVYFLYLLSVSTLVANIGFGLGLSEVKFLKELVFLVLAVGGAINIKKINLSPFFIGLGYILWALLSYFWSGSAMVDFLFGLKYEISFVALYYAVYLLGIRKKQGLSILKKIVKFASLGAFASILIWIFGNELLTMAGYRADWSTFYVGDATAFCQKIENLNICRLQGFLSGPNVFALYSLLILATAKYVGLSKKYIALLISAILLSFSRSGILALGLFLALGYVDGIHNLWKLACRRWKISSAITAMILFLILAFRPESNSEHLTAWKLGFVEFLNSPVLGHGVNFSGPASRFSDSVLIPESWFLQVADNLGLIGFGLFLAFGYQVYKKSPKVFQNFLIAMCIPLALLHSLEDAGFAYSLAVILGIVSSEEF